MANSKILKASVLATLCVLTIGNITSFIRISATEIHSRVDVQWYSVFNNLEEVGSRIEWGPSASTLTSSATGIYEAYTVSKDSVAFMCWNQASMTDLVPGSTIYYRVGSPAGDWSNVSSITVPPSRGSVVPVTFGVLGSLTGDPRAVLRRMKTEVAAGTIHAVLGVGESYCNSWSEECDDNTATNNEWAAIDTNVQEMLAPLTASVP
jgi:hypothetical protein